MGTERRSEEIQTPQRCPRPQFSDIIEHSLDFPMTPPAYRLPAPQRVSKVKLTYHAADHFSFVAFLICPVNLHSLISVIPT